MIKKIVNGEMPEVSSDKLTVVDFSAGWCGPCKMLEPVLEELSEEMSSQAAFFNADVDENPNLAQDFMITSIPALIVLKNGKEAARNVGFMPKVFLKEFIENNL
ncbi:thioredoxin [[Clostridium] polysaccharolyticum]|uniref:Thioredoxin n=1 Tax=[Clostridium] polysaccharolyticum TaxID=29364 RepID=A0A1I0ENB1_9FIRM|nr:thioredoxin [[Clostridium] polysaccharolyticum]SET46908.1 thioredoxin [[Clostridium] polysaccharolyticum]